MVSASRDDVTIPVPHGHVAGTLCVPEGAGVVQLLVHGYSYASYYWDPPYRPETHSYVRRATGAGYATLAVDRLGVGRSSRPAGRHLTWRTAARSVAAVVAALRSGELGTAFEQVVLVGHSYGSVTNYLAATMAPVDAMIATGAAHRASVPQMGLLYLGSPPVRGHGPLYATTRRGRRSFFYARENTDPEVIALDESLKQTAGMLELPTALPYMVNGVSRTTEIPVLTVLGDRDRFFARRTAADCSSEAALTRFEQRYYGPGAVLESVVVPGAGHNLNLERCAPLVFDRMLDFAARHVPSRATALSTHDAEEARHGGGERTIRSTGRSVEQDGIGSVPRDRPSST